MQHVIVFIVVCAAAGYVLWSLLPPLRRWFGAEVAAGCSGCSGAGCGAKRPSMAQEHVVKFVRRSRSDSGPSSPPASIRG